MTPRPRLVALLLSWPIYVAATIAHAQFGGYPPGGGMPPGGPQRGDEPREEGPAEEAPEDERGAAADQPIGAYRGQERRQVQVIELDGYLRFRTDWFHKLHLGQGYTGVGAGSYERTPPFPLPLECGLKVGSCSHQNLGGANLRLRLEPTINVSDQVRAIAQVDVLDNTLLGTTADNIVSITRPWERTGRAPSGLQSTSVDPPEVGRNGFASSVRAKRAWGEVDTEIGSLRFGRMPWHFGRGMTYNNGACPDCDGGTSVDRLMALTKMYGHQIALAWDFSSQGLSAGAVDTGRRDLEGYPLDLSQDDDVYQLMFAIFDRDDDRRFRERVHQGDLVLNYGAQFVYKRQKADYLREPTGTGGGAAAGDDPTLSREGLLDYFGTGLDARVIVPSVWFKLGWSALTVEFEATGVYGKLHNAGVLLDQKEATGDATLKQLGWILSTDLRLSDDDLYLGFEVGSASGDQAEDPSSYLNYRWKFVRQPPGDHKISDFKFSPDYHVDEILFRRILGTVTNATYFKPQLTYWVDLNDARQVGIHGALIYSLAQVPVSTPGNALSYGVELNLGLFYRNPRDGFYAGATYGVLWPMAALNRPGPSGGGQALWPAGEDAEAAQVFRTFFGIGF